MSEVRYGKMTGLHATIAFRSRVRIAGNEIVKRKRTPLWLFLFVCVCTIAGFCSATDIYITPTGTAQGVCTTSPQPPSWFNTASNWGSGSAQIGPGTTVHLCGTISTPLTAQGSGSNGSPITIFFESGASITAACGGSGCLNAAGLSYIVVDGGTACGWSSMMQGACNGTIKSSTATPSGSTFGIVATTCSNCEFRNLNIGPFFQAVAYGAYPTGDVRGIEGGGGSGTWLVHNNIITYASSAIVYIPSTSNDTALQVYNNVTANINSSVDISNSNNGTMNAALIHDNHFGSTAVWDQTGCSDHHNSLHAFAYTTTNNNIQYYNNLIDGNWGTCSTGGLFIEGNGSVNNNVTVFNNLWNISSYTQMNNGIVYISAGGSVRFYNNTILGLMQSGDVCLGVLGLTGASIYMENNIISGCNTLLSNGTGSNISLFTDVDYNVYGWNTSSPWTDQNIPAWYSTISSWRAHCSCDIHSTFGAASNYVGLNSSGVPSSSSPAVGAGATLTGLAALNYDITGTAPERAAPWNCGAYTLRSAPPNPSNLTATVP